MASLGEKKGLPGTQMYMCLQWRLPSMGILEQGELFAVHVMSFLYWSSTPFKTPNKESVYEKSSSAPAVKWTLSKYQEES